jgi:membrane protein required for colicin V production
MQTYDVLMLVVLVAATIFGMWKGMAWQIASVASLVLSYFIALKFADQLAPTFSGIAPPPLNKFVAMLVIYMATSFVIWSLFRFVSGVIDKVKLEYFDRQMGAIFGFAKGVLLCVAITFFAVSLLPQPQKEQILASQTGHYIVVLIDKTDSVVPPEIHDVIGPYLHRIEQQLDPNNQRQSQHANWPAAAFPNFPSLPATGNSTNAQPASATLPEATWPPRQNGAY